MNLTFLVEVAVNVFEIDPYIRVAMRSVLRSRSVIKRRIIFDYELIYVARGCFCLCYRDREYTCTAGQFLLLRPGVPHSFTMTDVDLSQPHIHFDLTYAADSRMVPVSFKDRGDLDERERRWIREDAFPIHAEKPFVTFSDSEEALSLFYSVIDSPRDTEGILGQKAAMIRLLALLIRDNFPDCLEVPAKLGIESQIKAYIDAEQGWQMTLSDFEKLFSYSKFHIEKRFRAAYGVSVMAYRNRKRMETARELLTRETVTAVSEKLGFRSIYSFSRAFKLHFGISPKDSTKRP